MSKNKIGLDDGQQEKLVNLMQFGQRATAIVTCMHTGGDEEIKATLMDLYTFAKEHYPAGPRQVAAEMNDIAHFCDLNLVTTPRSMDTGEPI